MQAWIEPGYCPKVQDNERSFAGLYTDRHDPVGLDQVLPARHRSGSEDMGGKDRQSVPCSAIRTQECPDHPPMANQTRNSSRNQMK
jgi:hypothetical protein